MVEPLGFEPKSYEFTLVLIVVETFLSPIWLARMESNHRQLVYKTSPITTWVLASNEIRTD